MTTSSTYFSDSNQPIQKHGFTATFRLPRFNLSKINLDIVLSCLNIQDCGAKNLKNLDLS